MSEGPGPPLPRAQPLYFMAQLSQKAQWITLGDLGGGGGGGGGVAGGRGI